MQGRIEESGAAISTSVAALEARVMGDPILIEQVIRNLASNAPDANAECNGDGCISLAAVLTGGFVDLSLRDNGMGLGLSISDNVAKDMGGERVLAPAPDQGVAARLRLRLPAVTKIEA